jgi:hypothetical protein
MMYDYAWEKLYTAVKTLATSKGRLQDRLAAAWLYSGMRLSNSVTSYLPKDLQAEYDLIDAALTKIQDPVLGAINATCAALPDDEADEIADRIVTLYDEVCRAHYQSDK